MPSNPSENRVPPVSPESSENIPGELSEKEIQKQELRQLLNEIQTMNETKMTEINSRLDRKEQDIASISDPALQSELQTRLQILREEFTQIGQHLEILKDRSRALEESSGRTTTPEATTPEITTPETVTPGATVPEPGIGERSRTFEEVRHLADLKRKLEETKKKMMEVVQKKEKSSGWLSKVTGKKAIVEAEYDILQDEYDRLNVEIKAESRVEGKKTLEFLEEQEKRTHETLREQYKIKESSLVKGWRWLGNMNMFNLMKSRAEKNPDGFWGKEMKKIESLPKWRQRMNQIGGNVFSLRTSITTGLAGFGLLGGSFQAATESMAFVGARTGAIGLGATLGDLDALGKAHMRLMGSKLDVFETEEQAKETVVKERHGLSSTDTEVQEEGNKISRWLKGRDKKKALSEASEATFLEDITEPEERLKVVSDKIHEYRGFAMAHDVDLDKDPTYRHLLEVRRLEMEKVPEEKQEQLLKLLEKLEKESFITVTRRLSKEKKDRWKRVVRASVFGGISAATFFLNKIGEFHRAFENALDIQDKGQQFVGGAVAGTAVGIEAKSTIAPADTSVTGDGAEHLPAPEDDASEMVEKVVPPKAETVVPVPVAEVEIPKPELAAVYEIRSGKGFLHGMNFFQRDPVLHDQIVEGLRVNHPEWSGMDDDTIIHKWRVDQAHSNGFLYGQRGVDGEFYSKTLHKGAKINLEFDEKGYPQVSVGKEHVTEHGMKFRPDGGRSAKVVESTPEVVKSAPRTVEPVVEVTEPEAVPKGDIRDVLTDEKLSGSSDAKIDDAFGTEGSDTIELEDNTATEATPVEPEPSAPTEAPVETPKEAPAEVAPEAKAPGGSVVEDHGYKFDSQYTATEREEILKSIEYRKAVIEAGRNHLAELQVEYGDRPQWGAFAEAYNDRLSNSEHQLSSMIDNLDNPSIKVESNINVTGDMTPEKYGDQVARSWEGFANSRTRLISIHESADRLSDRLNNAGFDDGWDNDDLPAEHHAKPAVEPKVEEPVSGGSSATEAKVVAEASTVEAGSYSEHAVVYKGEAEFLSNRNGVDFYTQPMILDDKRWLNVMFDETGEKIGYVTDDNIAALGEPEGGWPQGVPEKMTVPESPSSDAVEPVSPAVEPVVDPASANHEDVPAETAPAEEVVKPKETGFDHTRSRSEELPDSIGTKDGLTRVRTQDGAAIDFVRTDEGQLVPKMTTRGNVPWNKELSNEFFKGGTMPPKLSTDVSTYENLRDLHTYRDAYNVAVSQNGVDSEEARALLGQMKFYTKMLDSVTPAEIKDYLDPSFARTLGYHVEAPVEVPDVPVEVPDFDTLVNQSRVNIAWLSEASKGNIARIDSSAQIEAIKLKDSLDAAHEAKDSVKMQKVLKEVEELMDKNSTVSKSYTRIRTENSGGSSDVVIDR